MMMSRRGNALLLLMISLQQILSCRGGCSPSSCGKISNIKHPFRLKDDPANCGDERYELSCENNRTVLYLFPGKSYGVEAINYNNFTIRLVDPGISENDCSTLPRYSLSRSNFSDAYGFSQIPKEVTEPYAIFQDVGYGDKTGLFNHVIFLNCSNPIRDDDGTFVDASPCIDGKGDHHRHVYAGVEGLKVAELTQLRNDCRLMVAASSVFGGLHRNLSYGEIHRRLSYGFELSWMLGGVCASVCGDLKTCFFNEATQNITCVDSCQGPTQVECRKVSKLQIVVEEQMVDRLGFKEYL